jgi:hypothetical protein
LRGDKALEVQASEISAARRQLALALTQARYDAAHARRQYDAVDPANRLVAGELERRWNDALRAVHGIERGDRGDRSEEAGAAGREGAAAPDAAWRRSGACLVASGRQRGDAHAPLPSRFTHLCDLDGVIDLDVERHR